jgi:hypothetical protein
VHPKLVSILKHRDIVDSLIEQIESRRSVIDPYRKCDGVIDRVEHMIRCSGKNDQCTDIVALLNQLHEEAKQKDQDTR